MTDRHLVEMRQAAKEDEVVQIEIVTRVDAEAQLVREAGGLGAKIERTPRRLRTLLERARERFGVKLDAVGAR